MAFSDSYKYKMYLSYNYNAELTVFPILPDTIRVSYGSNVEETDVIGLGGVIRRVDRPAVTLTFSVVLPPRDFYGSKLQTVQAPEMIKDRLRRWQIGEPPCRFMISETGINMDCRIAEFTYSEKGGDKGAIYIDFVLKEHRPVSPKEVTINAAGGIVVTSNDTRSDEKKELPKSYKTVKGDKLTVIAKNFYEDSSRWHDIFDANAKAIINPALLQPGTTLVLPPR